MTLRVVSFGGGVQSTALLVLAAQGQIEYRTFVFANVGEDSENPDTLAYIREHSRPFAAAHGLELIEVRRETRGGETLLARTLREERSIRIPMRPAGGKPGNRTCTQDHKRAVVARWLRDHGATKAAPAVVAIGFSVDEFQRIHGDSGYAFQRFEYPLVRPLRLSRTDCLGIVRDAGLPPPPKSSCWFCPFKRPAEWRDLRDRHPDLFARAADLERELCERSVALGRMPVYLTRFGKPLPMAVDDGGQMRFDDEEAACDSGFCWR